jgi:short-subunit dehydrogenase
MQVPVMAAFHVARAFIPVMQTAKPKCIVTMTSFAAYLTFSGAAAYIMSRRAMLSLHDVLREEVAGSNIRCCIAYFSKVQSPYWDHNIGSEERLPKSHRLIRTISCEEAATAIVRGILRNKQHMYAPRILWVFKQATRWMPGLVRVIVRATSYRGVNHAT